MSKEPSEITRILLEIRSLDETDRDARERLFNVIYGELRRLAGDLMRGERPDHTLRPTALVHEAYLRLVEGDRVRWENRAHFFGIAARAMRQILVDHAREKAALKRGGDRTRVSLEPDVRITADPDLRVLDLDRALGRLEGIDSRMARVVELRTFGGLTINEVAAALAMSPSTVDQDWHVATLWLRREFASGSA